MIKEKEFLQSWKRKKRLEKWTNEGDRIISRVIKKKPAEIFQGVTGFKPSGRIKLEKVKGGIILAVNKEDYLKYRQDKESLGSIRRGGKYNKLGIGKARIGLVSNKFDKKLEKHEAAHIINTPFGPTTKDIHILLNKGKITELQFLNQYRKYFQDEINSAVASKERLPEERILGSIINIPYELNLRSGKENIPMRMICFENKKDIDVPQMVRKLRNETINILDTVESCQNKNVPPEVLSGIIMTTPWNKIRKTLNSIFGKVKK